MAGAVSTTRCTGPSEHTTAVIRVSRSTGSRIPWMVTGGNTEESAKERSMRSASDRPPADSKPVGGVVGDGGVLAGPRLEADVDGGGVAVGRRGVHRRVELVGRDHLGAFVAQALGHVAGEGAEAAELPDDDAAAGAARCRPRSSCSSSRMVATPGPVPVRAPLISSARTVAEPQTPSTSSPQLRWKSSRARAVAGPKMPSTRPQSNPRRPSSVCSVPTSSPRWNGAISRSGRSPSRHDASTSASQVGSSQSPWAWRPRCSWNARTASCVDDAELAGLGADRAEPGGAEPALQVLDGVAVLPEGQLLETRNSSSSWSSWDLPLAPTRRLLTSPPENTSSVGMLITL